MILATLSRIAGALIEAVPAGPDGRERRGFGPGVSPGGVWLHGASVGEIASAEALLAALPGPAIVTANTLTGRARAAATGRPASLAPWDTPQALGRFLDRTRPALAITVESELWPIRSDALARRGIPQMVVGARMSARSARRWARLPGLARRLLGRIDALSAQDAASEARLLALGLREAALLPRLNLKRWSSGAAPRLPEGPHRAQTVLLASPHADEEPAILAATALLRAAGRRVILAPRHPERFEPLARALPEAARRSLGADADAPLLLADSMGEMPLWCAAAGVAVICGSFAAHGGHSPWEAARQGCAILHGPDTANFAADYADLAPAAVATTADRIAADILALTDAEARGAHSAAILARGQQDAAPILEAARRLQRGATGPISSP